MKINKWDKNYSDDLTNIHNKKLTLLVEGIQLLSFCVNINENMSKVVVKNTIILSLILGMIAGIFAFVPYIGLWALILVLIFSAPIVMIYMIMDSKFDFTTTVNSIIVGAISGFSSNISFSLVYILVAVILSKIFNITTNFILTAMIINSPFWLIVVFMIFMGILFGTTNAFSGFLTHYVIEFIRDIYEKKNKGL